MRLAKLTQLAEVSWLVAFGRFVKFDLLIDYFRLVEISLVRPDWCIITKTIRLHYKKKKRF